MSRAEQDALALRRILARIIGHSEDGKVYLAEDAPPDRSSTSTERLS